MLNQEEKSEYAKTFSLFGWYEDNENEDNENEED